MVLWVNITQANTECARGELNGDCGAENPTSKQKILSALNKTSLAFSNQTKPVENWLENYYQYANRLAVLYFQMRECIPPVNARLLLIDFMAEIEKMLIARKLSRNSRQPYTQ